MSEPLWDELLRSPLDPDPNALPSQVPGVVLVVVAAVVGLALGLTAFPHDNAADVTPSTATPTTTTTTTLLPDPDPIVSPGYVDVDGLAFRPAVAYVREGNLYLVVSQTTRSDLNATETRAFHAADWTLDLEGRQVVATREITSPMAPGFVTLEFAGESDIPEPSARILVRRASEMVVRTGCQGCAAVSAHEAHGEIVLPSVARPFTLDAPMLIEVGPDITLAIDRLEFTDEWGYGEWHVINENAARIRPELRVTFTGTDDPAIEGTQPTQLIPTHMLGTNQQSPTTANSQPFARSGTVELDRRGELVSEANAPSSLVLEWTVEWIHPLGEPVELTIDGTADLGVLE